jgi:aldose 1-epimerase
MMAKKRVKFGLTVATLAAATPALAATAKRLPFGTLPDGRVVEAVELRGENGVTARIITLGATLQSLETPDRSGRLADITLGHDNAKGYVEQPNYWGQTIGRYANRIAKGRFTLDGKEYRLPVNNGENSLHGGTDGFDKRNWRILSVESGARAKVVLALTSPDGDQGYPGKLEVTVSYSLDDAGSLAIDLDAKSDAPTIVNLTNHALFNLAGEGAPGGIYGHRLTIAAGHYTPVDETLIPTGRIAPVAGTPFDFTRGRTLEDGIRDGRNQQIAIARGWDHNFVLDKGATAEPRFAARVEDPVSGRTLEVFTTEPGLQFYSGNSLFGRIVGKRGHVYRMGDGFALEPQKFPDTPNKPAFGSARVEPGRPYHHGMIYRISVAADP